MRQILSGFILLLLSNILYAETDNKAQKRADYIRSHYTKYEYQIPMRDGITLFTAVYVPTDDSQKYPMLMERTPYSVAPYGVNKYMTRLGPGENFEKEGYIFVFQDVRGQFLSEGEYVNMRPQDAYKKGGNATDDATDTYDTIDWLIQKVPNNNGKVGMWGTSYPGFYTSVGAINSHKALKAISPQAPIADWFFDDFHRNGAFVVSMAFLFFDAFDLKREGLYTYMPQEIIEPTTPDGYDFFHKLGPMSNVNKNYFKGERPFWNDITEHPNYDEYWQAKNVLQHFNNIKPATLIVGGWFDTEDLYGPLATYQTMSKNNRNENVHLVMGPWSHGQWNDSEGSKKLGEADFGFDTITWYQDNIQLPFFNQHLKGKDSANLATATVFETGANRWRKFANWPPQRSKQQSLYFAANQKLASKLASGASYSEYISDPNKPVPYSANINSGWTEAYMVEDQRFSARRTDVLVFETETAEKDQTIAGEIKLDLWVSTSESAADFVVKLIDVYPGMNVNDNVVDKETGNRHELVRWGVIRGRYRNSMSTPEPFQPDVPTQVQFELYDVLHTIKRGHKLQIQIQSSMFPFIDRNPQKYVDNIFKAKAEDFVKATHRIYHSSKYPSSISYKLIDGRL
jgi:hypothetical protein